VVENPPRHKYDVQYLYPEIGATAPWLSPLAESAYATSLRRDTGQHPIRATGPLHVTGHYTNHKRQILPDHRLPEPSPHSEASSLHPLPHLKIPRDAADKRPSLCLF